MPAQTGVVTNDLGDFLQIVVSFDGGAPSQTFYVTKSDVLARDLATAKAQAAIGYPLLESADTNWATLNAAQKDAAARASVKAAAAFCRFVLERL